MYEIKTTPPLGHTEGTSSVTFDTNNQLPNKFYKSALRATPPTCPRVQVYFTDRIIKNVGFNEIK